MVGRNVLADPRLMAMVGTDEYVFTGGDGVVHSVDRRNRMFELYPGAVGLKTGLTDAAGRCLVAAATRDGRTMLAVLFDAPDMYATAALLLDRGFATPTDGQDDLELLPDVVPDATLDPPTVIEGAVAPDLGPIIPAPESAGGLDDPAVAVLVLLAGAAPAFALRRRLRGGRGDEGRDGPPLR